MRSHDRGMSGGGCANGANAPVPAAASGWGPLTGDCSVVEPWNIGPSFFEAARLALQARETLIPYIYNTHREAFDTGIGLVRPMVRETVRFTRTKRDGAVHGTSSRSRCIYRVAPAPVCAPLLCGFFHLPL